MPNITFVVSVTINKILSYLKRTSSRGILFKKNEGLLIEAYTSVDYAGSVVDHRSTSGYCTFIGGNLITWMSKKSSAEVEFRVITHGFCELLWLKIILDDFKIKWEGPMKLYCDNKSAIGIAYNPVQT
ncbi:Copia protein [Gossypium australe]|uniref:Copia protein n=1 Tax=Gossypium australe TaxID=47621 RepID=A0A5B6WDY0_9ROSI|nr:Copia protein [Gossypium australe]